MGLAGWQQEHWRHCCDDAAAYLGLAVDAPPGLPATTVAGSMYLFRCPHRRAELSYSDAP